MTKLEFLLEEVVTANRILAREGVVDSFGHVSARHPDNPQRFLLSRARAPDCIEVGDIMEFTLEGEAVNAQGRAPYLERFIHGGIYEARPDVHSVVHNHSPSVIPFGVTGGKLKPLLHMCANIGHEVPIWDSYDKFGDTVRQAVFISIYLEVNAKLQMQAMAMGDIKFLTPGEVDKIMARTGPYSINRAWENWCRRAGRLVTEVG